MTRDIAPHILIVEDEAPVRQLLATALQSAGYTVSTAEEGSEALQRLRSGPAPNLILLDLALPGLDGGAFRAEQRWDPEHGDIPVVVISGTPPDPEHLAHLAPAAYVTKPFDLAHLLELVAGLCPPG